MKKAEVIEMEFASVDLKVRCKCGEVFDEVDKDVNTWVLCPKCNQQYNIYFNFDNKDVKLQEI